MHIIKLVLGGQNSFPKHPQNHTHKPKSNHCFVKSSKIPKNKTKKHCFAKSHSPPPQKKTKKQIPQLLRPGTSNVTTSCALAPFFSCRRSCRSSSTLRSSWSWSQEGSQKEFLKVNRDPFKKKWIFTHCEPGFTTGPKLYPWYALICDKCSK